MRRGSGSVAAPESATSEQAVSWSGDAVRLQNLRAISPHFVAAVAAVGAAAKSAEVAVNVRQPSNAILNEVWRILVFHDLLKMYPMVF